jgi:hypothetical protein
VLSKSSKTRQKTAKDNPCGNSCKTKAMPGKSFLVEGKIRALAWAKNGMSTTSIAQKIGHSDRLVQRLISTSKSLPINTIPKRKVGSGRKSTLSPMDLRVLKRHVL